MRTRFSSALAAIVVLWLALPAAAACQTGQATVTVIDRSVLEVTIDPPSYTGEIGDTVTFVATAVDTVTGEEVPAQIRWSSLDSTGVSIDPVTGLATLLRGGTYTVEAEVLEIISLLIFTETDDGTWREVYTPQRHAAYARNGSVPDELTLQGPECLELWRGECFNWADVGETRQLCMIVQTQEGATRADGQPDICPSWAEIQGTLPMEDLLRIRDMLSSPATPG